MLRGPYETVMWRLKAPKLQCSRNVIRHYPLLIRRPPFRYWRRSKAYRFRFSPDTMVI